MASHSTQDFPQQPQHPEQTPHNKKREHSPDGDSDVPKAAKLSEPTIAEELLRHRVISPAERRQMLMEEPPRPPIICQPANNANDFEFIFPPDAHQAAILRNEADSIETTVINFDYNHVVAIINYLILCDRNELPGLFTPGWFRNGTPRLIITLDCTADYDGPVSCLNQWLQIPGHDSKTLIFDIEYRVSPSIYQAISNHPGALVQIATKLPCFVHAFAVTADTLGESLEDAFKQNGGAGNRGLRWKTMLKAKKV